MNRKRKALGSMLVAALLVAATALVAANFTSLRDLAAALRSASPAWIAGGVLVHGAYFVAYALLYRLGFGVVGVRSRTWPLVPLVLEGMFVNVVVPTGAGAAALFIDDAERRGESGARAAVGVVLVLLLDLVTLAPLVAWGVWFLARARIFSSWEVAGVAAFALYVVGLVALVVLARSRPDGVRRALDRVRRLVSRKRDWLARDWPARTASRLRDAADAIRRRRGGVAVAALWALVLHLVNLLGLWLFLRGFGAVVPIGGLVAAFSTAIVFFVVVVLPQAAPIVEAVMMAIFVRVGVDPGRAVAATLAFRAVNFWLPLALGLALSWRIRRFGAREAA